MLRFKRDIEEVVWSRWTMGGVSVWAFSVEKYLSNCSRSLLAA